MNKECKHCNKLAEWRWDDDDGNEHSYICQNCMETLSIYADKPLWQFTALELEKNAIVTEGRP